MPLKTLWVLVFRFRSKFWSQKAWVRIPTLPRRNGDPEEELASPVSAPSPVKQGGVLASSHGVRVKRVRTQHHAKQEVLINVTRFHCGLTFKSRLHSLVRLASVVQPPKRSSRSPGSWSPHPRAALPTTSTANVWSRCEIAHVPECGF